MVLLGGVGECGVAGRTVSGARRAAGQLDLRLEARDRLVQLGQRRRQGPDGGGDGVAAGIAGPVDLVLLVGVGITFDGVGITFDGFSRCRSSRDRPPGRLRYGCRKPLHRGTP